MIKAIAHPTDFSPAGQAAFEHALRLALVNRCRLDILHVHAPGREDDWDRFPHVRETLERWGMIEPDTRAEDIHAKTGVEVRKVEIRDAEPYEGLSRYLTRHRPDLIVMASHGRAGLGRWVQPSVYAEVAYDRSVPTLLFGPSAQPFVDSATGRIALGRILVPVDRDPDPQQPVDLLETLTQGLDAELDFLHVGRDAPALLDGAKQPRTVRAAEGPVVETLLDQARQASLVAMPMAGVHGFLDVIRGSTTERVVHDAPCPVLALPAAPGEVAPPVTAMVGQTG